MRSAGCGMRSAEPSALPDDERCAYSCGAGLAPVETPHAVGQEDEGDGRDIAFGFGSGVWS